MPLKYKHIAPTKYLHGQGHLTVVFFFSLLNVKHECLWGQLANLGQILYETWGGGNSA